MLAPERLRWVGLRLGAYFLVWGAVHWVGLHHFHALLALAALDVATNGRNATDRILVSLATVVGAVPVFGWVAWPSVVDPLVLVIALWFVSILSSRMTDRVPVRWTGEVVPAAIGAVFTYQWWCGMSKGSPATVLERLAPIWDLSAHFNFYLTCLMKRTYIIATDPPGQGLRWEGTEYPAGIHYVWARFAENSRDAVITQSDRAIPIFANSVVVTIAVAVGVIGLCTARLANDGWRRTSLAIIGTGVGAGIVALGPMSQAAYAGFANMTPVAIGVALFATFFLRPHENERVQLWVLGCSTVAVIYNWYPISTLLLPAYFVVVTRFVKGGRRRDAVLLSALIAVGGGPAVLQTLSLGVKHLELPGGVQQFSPGLFAVLLLGSFALGLFLIGNRRFRATSALLFTPLVGALALGIRLRLATDSYPYYFHKASLFIGTSAALFLCFVIVYIVTEAMPENHEGGRGVRAGGLQFASALVLAVAISQTFGYWGVDYPAFAGGSTSVAVLTRNEITKGDTNLAQTAELVVKKAREVRSLPIKERSCLNMVIPSRVGAKPDSPVGPWNLTLYNVWFHGLTQSYTFQAKEQAYMTPNVAPALGNESDLVAKIVDTFDPGSVCIFSTEVVVMKLRDLSDRWQLKSFES